MECRISRRNLLIQQRLPRSTASISNARQAINRIHLFSRTDELNRLFYDSSNGECSSTTRVTITKWLFQQDSSISTRNPAGVRCKAGLKNTPNRNHLRSRQFLERTRSPTISDLSPQRCDGLSYLLPAFLSFVISVFSAST